MLGKSNDEVGYKKPPKDGQFKKGQSGNSKGRPKRTKTVGSVIREVVNHKVTVRENGKPQKVPFIDAFVRALIEKGLKRSTNDQLKILKMIELYAPETLKEYEAPLRFITEYVLPNGKTMEDYDNYDRSRDSDEAERRC